MTVLIGNASIGTSNLGSTNQVNVGKFQAPGNATIGQLVWYTAHNWNETDAIKMCIYDDTGAGGIPNNLLAETVELVGNVTNDTGWFAADLVTPLAITSGVWYWLGINMETASPSIRFVITGGVSRSVTEAYAVTFSDPWNTSGNGSDTYLFSIYGTEARPPATGTLGYESAGASSQSVSANQHLVCQFTAGYTGIIRKLKGYISNFAGGEYLRFTLYSNIANTPGTLVSFTDQIEGTGVDGWVTAELTYPIIITSGVTYWLGVQASASIDVAYDTGESENSRIATDTWPEPLKTWTGGTNTIRKYSIYASLDSVTTRWIGHKAILEILDNDGPWINSVWLERVSAVENLTITTINSYFDVNFTAGKYVKAVVYSDNGTDTPIDLLGVSAEYEGDGIARVRSFPLLSPVNFVAGETYWIGYIAPQDTYNTIGHNVPLPGNYNYGVDDTYSDGPEDPCNSPGDYATASWTPVIYAAEAVPEGGGSDAQPGIMVDML